jgi:predicted KAP-like P-loop ATPase
MTPDCPTRLLSDAPTSDDAFGSHTQVARAISDLICQESGGKAIAITGSWGSGKSTVIEILDTLLKGKTGKTPPFKTVKMFVYNAWAHEGDPLRRSFLESFLQFLIDAKWADEKTWKDALEELTRRKEKTDTVSDPVLTKWGIAMALAALLVLCPINN